MTTLIGSFTISRSVIGGGVFPINVARGNGLWFKLLYVKLTLIVKHECDHLLINF